MHTIQLQQTHENAIACMDSIRRSTTCVTLYHWLIIIRNCQRLKRYVWQRTIYVHCRQCWRTVLNIHMNIVINTCMYRHNADITGVRTNVVAWNVANNHESNCKLFERASATRNVRPSVGRISPILRHWASSKCNATNTHLHSHNVRCWLRRNQNRRHRLDERLWWIDTNSAEWQWLR